MGERTEHAPGTHSWVDLSTSDVESAKRFYTEILGWQRTEDREAGEDATYTMAYVGDKPVAGLFQAPDDGMPPHWNCYVDVADVFEAAGAVEEAGGEVALAPFDVLDVGSMAVIKDPSGAFLSLWQAKKNPGAQRVNEPGCLTWNDLNTSDAEAAQKFYEQVFGWSFEKAGGEEYPYWIIQNGDRRNGGMRAFSEEETSAGLMSHWLPYFAVEDAEAALQRASGLGATVMAGPTDVPGGGRFGVIQDEQGAVVGLFAGKFDD